MKHRATVRACYGDFVEVRVVPNHSSHYGYVGARNEYVYALRVVGYRDRNEADLSRADLVSLRDQLTALLEET